jgi:hypothetical protein
VGPEILVGCRDVPVKLQKRIPDLSTKAGSVERKALVKRTLLTEFTYSDSLNIELETLGPLVMGDKCISDLWYIVPCIVTLSTPDTNSTKNS